MRVACLGDVMLDIIVATERGIIDDDDTQATITFAPGGQAANVAAWVAHLGGQATVFGPGALRGSGRLVQDTLNELGVTVQGPGAHVPGTVVSLLSGGRRSLATDAGDVSWLKYVEPGPWLNGADWLFVSGYAMLRSSAPERIVAVAEAARVAGTRVGMDLSSATMIESFGAARFTELWQSLRLDAMFGNDHEWAVTGPVTGLPVQVIKHGARGCTFIEGGTTLERAPEPGPVVDATGAGDALAAGYLVGGPDLAMKAAAACVAHLGAQPQLRH